MIEDNPKETLQQTDELDIEKKETTLTPEPNPNLYRTNILTSRKARDLTRRNLEDLGKITGETYNINI